MALRSASSRLVTLGVLAGVVAFALWCVQLTAFDTARFERAAGDVATSAAVQNALASQVADATIAALGPSTPIQEVVIGRAADQAVTEPVFVDAFAAVAGRIHRHLLDGDRTPIPIDPGAVNAAMRQALARVSPPDAASLPPDTRIVVTVDELPDLAVWARLVRSLTGVLAVAAAVLVLVGIAASPRRMRMVGRVGRGAAAAGAASLLFGVLLPLAVESTGGWLGVISIVVGSGQPLLGPSLALLVGGAGLVTVVHRLEAHARHHALAVVPGPRAGAPWRV